MAAGSKWTRKDAMIVLASYLDRPLQLMIPPLRERERVANLVRRPVADVTARLWMFAGLDPDGKSSDAGAPKLETDLWNHFADARLDLMLAVDDIIQERRGLPRYFSD